MNRKSEDQPDRPWRKLAVSDNFFPAELGSLATRVDTGRPESAIFVDSGFCDLGLYFRLQPPEDREKTLSQAGLILRPTELQAVEAGLLKRVASVIWKNGRAWLFRKSLK